MDLQKENSFRILSLEAKIIYDQNQSNPQKGVCVDVDLKNRDYDVCEHFLNTLDWSLDSEKLIEVYEKQERRKFYRTDMRGTKFTDAVINVSFEYKYEYKEDAYEDNQEAIRIMDTSALRGDLYKNGFLCNGKRYVRYKRSSGSSREGNCLFILETLKRKMDEWSACGLIFDEEKHDLASWEAYRALSLSSIIGILNLAIENILFIEDYKSIFTEEVVEVSVNGKTLNAQKKKAEIKNDIWDGEALLDESLFLGAFEDKHMLLLRNRFFKTCAFKTRLQKWFKDNNATIETVKANGKTLAKKIEDIFMVTTPSSLKYLKFLDEKLTVENIQKWADNVDGKFGIVKYDKRTHFFNGDKVQTSYQLLNTLSLTQEETENLLLPSREYLRLIRSDMAVLDYHLSEAFQGEDIHKNTDDEEIVGKERAILELLETNALISRTRIFIDFRNRMVESFKKNLKRGHILFSGTNATLFGNGPELLLASLGLFNKPQPQSILATGTVRCEKFAEGQELLGARSPHVTMGNLYIVNNRLGGEIWNYFDLGENIVCVNAIGENIQQRLNGCDYDSDTMLLTEDVCLLESAKVGYTQFPVPVIKKPEKEGEKTKDLLGLDKKISVNKIGEIINLSQRLNSLYWERKYCGVTEKQEELYLDICKLAVLSGVEIDRAKREFPIPSGSVLREIFEKYKTELSIRPKFFEMLDGENQQKYQQPSNKKPRDYHFLRTVMDYIVSSVDKMQFRVGREKKIQYIKVLDLFDNTDVTRNDGNKRKTALNLLDELNKKIVFLRKKKLYASETEKASIEELIQSKKEEAVEKLRAICNTKGATYLMIKELDKMLEGQTENNYKSLLFETLFNPKNELIYSMIKKQESFERLERNVQGEIDLYGIKFAKILKNISKK